MAKNRFVAKEAMLARIPKSYRLTGKIVFKKLTEAANCPAGIYAMLSYVFFVLIWLEIALYMQISLIKELITIIKQ